MAYVMLFITSSPSVNHPWLANIYSNTPENASIAADTPDAHFLFGAFFQLKTPSSAFPNISPEEIIALLTAFIALPIPRITSSLD